MCGGTPRGRGPAGGSPASSSARGWGAAGRLGPGAQLLWRQVSGSRPRPWGSVRDAAPHVWGHLGLQARPGGSHFPGRVRAPPPCSPPGPSPSRCQARASHWPPTHLPVSGLGTSPRPWLRAALSPGLPGSAPVPGVAGALFWGSRGAAGRVGRGGETGALAGREGMERRWPGRGQGQRGQRPTVTGRGLGQLWLRPAGCRFSAAWWVPGGLGPVCHLGQVSSGTAVLGLAMVPVWGCGLPCRLWAPFSIREPPGR